MKRKTMISGALVLGLIILAVSMVIKPTAKEVLGISAVNLENIQSITFYRHLGTQEEWETSDPVIIKDIMEHFEGVVLLPASPGVGGYLSIRFSLIEPINDRTVAIVNLPGPTWYSGQINSNGTVSGYKAIFGAHSGEDWDAILEQCEKIK